MTKKSFSHTEIREKLQEDRNKTKGKGRVKFNDLDPMDPASYSDIPRYTLISCDNSCERCATFYHFISLMIFILTIYHAIKLVTL